MSGDESTPIVEGDSWCTSDINGSANGTFTWKIKGFKEFHPAYSLQGTKSSVFPIRGDRDSRWMLEIKPNTIKTIKIARIIAIKSQDSTSQAKKGSAFFNTASYIDIGIELFFLKGVL